MLCWSNFMHTSNMPYLPSALVETLSTRASMHSHMEPVLPSTFCQTAFQVYEHCRGQPKHPMEIICPITTSIPRRCCECINTHRAWTRYSQIPFAYCNYSLCIEVFASFYIILGLLSPSLFIISQWTLTLKCTSSANLKAFKHNSNAL